MPFLRFTRDARGYESTSVLHTARRRGKSHPRILYWFRTPPNVRVGRAPLDEDAIRAIEKSNPDLTFDWDAILDAQPGPAASIDSWKTERRPRRGDRPRRPEPPREAAGVVPVERQDEHDSRAAEVLAAPGETSAIDLRDGTAPVVLEAGGLPDALLPDIAEEPVALVFGEEPLTGVDEPWDERAPSAPADSGATAALETLVGAEGLARLRTRFAEIQARISERGLDPAGEVDLRRRAELLNPDAWVTLDEARTGIDQYELRLDEVRRVLGPQRRRSRRGGRHRNRKRRDAQGLPSTNGQAREVAHSADSDSDPKPQGPAASPDIDPGNSDLED